MQYKQINKDPINTTNQTGTVTAMIITVFEESELLDVVVFAVFVSLVGIGQTQSLVELEFESSPLGHTLVVTMVLL